MGETVHHGMCQCGCGRPAPIASCSSAPKGWVKGKPLRFIRGHIGGINAARIYQTKLGVASDGTPTKLCTCCGDPKPQTEFDVSQWRADRLRSHCRSCKNTQSKALYRRDPEPFKLRAYRAKKKARKEIRERVARIRTKGCRACDERDVACIEFHHVHGKDRYISHCESIPQLERELIKCVVLCANCHKKAHADRLLISTGMLCAAGDGKETT